MVPLLTEDVPLCQFWDLIEQQGHNVHSSCPLLKVPSTMRNDLDHFLDEALVCRNLPIPAIDEFFHNDSNDSVKL